MTLGKCVSDPVEGRLLEVRFLSEQKIDTLQVLTEGCRFELLELHA